MKSTETACVSDELCRFQEEKGDNSRIDIKRVRGRLAISRIPTVNYIVEALEQL